MTFRGWYSKVMRESKDTTRCFEAQSAWETKKSLSGEKASFQNMKKANHTIAIEGIHFAKRNLSGKNLQRGF